MSQIVTSSIACAERTYAPAGIAVLSALQREDVADVAEDAGPAVAEDARHR